MAHRTRKRFGQHFLRDTNCVHRIVNAINPGADEHLVEIGPGKGILTEPLARRCGYLDVIELDRDLITELDAIARSHGNILVHNNDALEVDLCGLAAEHPPIRVVGNLPYNISTPLLFHFLDHLDCITDMHIMLQEEVVDRVIAGPGGKDYGRLSIMVQFRCVAEKLFTIGPEAFAPAPRVQSALVRLAPRSGPAVHVGDQQLFARVVKTAFSQRRKTLRNSLNPLLSREEIQAAGIAPEKRPEQLSIADFAALSNWIFRNPR